nr:hypothetical protein [uncultured Methanoregula sp.]
MSILRVLTNIINLYTTFLFFVLIPEKKRKDMVTFLAVRVEPEKGNGSIPGEGIFCGIPEAGCFFAGCPRCRVKVVFRESRPIQDLICFRDIHWMNTYGKGSS